MSLFTEASLVLVPSGIKNQKIYSIKPTDGSGDLTFSRASNATRVNSSGLVEKVRTNETLYSEDFTQTNWDVVGVSVTANTIINPINGATTADTLTASAGTSTHYIYDDAISYSAGENTISIYAKYNNNQWVCFQWYDGSSAYEASFDIQNGVAGAIGSGVSSSITSIGSGWYRISLTATSASGGTGYYVLALNDSDTASIKVWTAAGTESAYIFGAQVEAGVMTDYIATTSSTVSVGPVSGLPRLDYSGGASCPSLLLEPQRTNINTYSSAFNDTSYGLTNATITANTTISPDGYTNADTITDNATNGNHRFIKGISGTTSGQPYTYSIFLKKGTMETAYLNLFSGGTIANATVDLNAGTIASDGSGTNHTIEAYGNDWYRCSITGTAGDTTVYIYCYLKQIAGYVGNGDTLHLYGAQLEAGSYATSYIPTLGSAVTRLADACSKTGISSLIGQTEGTLYGEFEAVETSVFTNLIPTISDGTINNSIKVYYDPNVSGIRAFIRTAGSLQTNTAVAATLNAGTNKIAVSYKLNDLKVYLNGSQIITDGSITVPATSKVSLFSDEALTVQEKIEGKQALIFPTALTATQMAELTA